MAKKRVSFRVHGRVQGVYYRKSAQQKARSLGLGGWVANESQGTVLIEAEGREDKVAALLDWCKEGPPLAKVSHLEILQSDISSSEGRFSDFEVRY